jgi:hypothetical protein
MHANFVLIIFLSKVTETRRDTGRFLLAWDEGSLAFLPTTDRKDKNIKVTKKHMAVAILFLLQQIMYYLYE